MVSSRSSCFRHLVTTYLLVFSISWTTCTTTADEPRLPGAAAAAAPAAESVTTARRASTAGVGWSGDTDALGLVTSPNPPPPKGCQPFKDFVAVKAFVQDARTKATMVDRLRLEENWNLVTRLYDAHVEGDIVECGVWKGGSSMTMVASHMARKRLYRTRLYRAAPESIRALDRHFWLFDTFEALDDVRANMARTCYAPVKFHYVKGKVEDALVNATNLPQRIALLRLDTDVCASTKAQLSTLIDRMAPGTYAGGSTNSVYV